MKEIILSLVKKIIIYGIEKKSYIKKMRLLQKSSEFSD